MASSFDLRLGILLSRDNARLRHMTGWFLEITGRLWRDATIGSQKKRRTREFVVVRTTLRRMLMLRRISKAAQPIRNSASCRCLQAASVGRVVLGASARPTPPHLPTALAFVQA